MTNNAYTIYDLGYAKSLVKDDAFYVDMGVTANKTDSGVNPSLVVSGEWTGNQKMTDGFFQSANFVTGISGWKLFPDGDIEASNGIFRGAIYATTGYVGGFVIGLDYIKDVANSFGFSSTVTAGDDIRFWAGETFVNRASAPFRITESGAFFSSSATISGSITATSGTIGGFTIGTNSIVDAGNSFGLSSDVTGGDDVRFWAGATYADRATAPLRITEAGAISATSGAIGGFTITATALYGGIIKTALDVSLGQSGVIMNTAGLRGYDSVLGLVFNIPTDGSAPTFSSGIINNTVFNVNTNAVIRTSATVGDGTVNSAGILINNTGIYACEASQLLASANVKIGVDGSASFKGTITALSGTFGPWTISGNTFSTTAENIFIGTNAGASISTGHDNFFAGAYSGTRTTEGYNNCFICEASGYFNISGYNNVAIGNAAMQGYEGASGTGHDNTIMGFGAGSALSSGHNNIGIGNYSLGGQNTSPNYTTGIYNVCLGADSGGNLVGGSSNVFLGWVSGASAVSSNANVCIGERSGYLNTSDNNVFVGYKSGIGNVGGYSNLYLGFECGYTNVSGNNNVFLGTRAGYYETGANKLFIDNIGRASEADARVKALIYGIFATTTANQHLYLNGNVYISDTLTIGGTALSSLYQPLDADLTAIAGLSSADSNFIVGSAGGWVAESGATARTSLGVAIGTNVQAYNSNLTGINQALDTTSSPTFAGMTWTSSGPEVILKGTATTSIVQFSLYENTSTLGGFLQYRGSGASLPKTLRIGTYISGGSVNVLYGEGSTGISISSSGAITLPNLAGTGSRLVVADANGLLSAPVSDERLKTNIKPIGTEIAMGMLEDENIHGINYQWKDEKKGKDIELGFTAQMFSEYNIAGLTFEDKGVKGLNYDRLCVLLWEQNRELLKRIKKLEDK